MRTATSESHPIAVMTGASPGTAAMPAASTAAIAPATGIFRSGVPVLYHLLANAMPVVASTGTITPEATSVPHIARVGPVGRPPGHLRGRAVLGPDVGQSPPDLRGGVGLPPGAGRGHLGPGVGLRDSVRVVVGVGLVVGRELRPAGFFLPPAFQVGPLPGPGPPVAAGQQEAECLVRRRR